MCGLLWAILEVLRMEIILELMRAMLRTTFSLFDGGAKDYITY